MKNAACCIASLQYLHCKDGTLCSWLHLFTKFHLYLFVYNAVVTVQGPYCYQLLLVPVQCTVSFIIYAGPIWSDKASPSSEAITNNNDDKTQRIFLLYFENDCFVLHDGTSCISLGAPGNHLLTSCHQIHIKQGHPEAHLGGSCSFTIPAGLPWPEVRLCMRWIHDHCNERNYLNIL